MEEHGLMHCISMCSHAVCVMSSDADAIALRALLLLAASNPPPAGGGGGGGGRRGRRGRAGRGRGGGGGQAHFDLLIMVSETFLSAPPPLVLLLCFQVGLCHLGDYLLSQLDCCAPQLTKLVMPDVDVNGTGDWYTVTVYC